MPNTTPTQLFCSDLLLWSLLSDRSCRWLIRATWLYLAKAPNTFDPSLSSSLLHWDWQNLNTVQIWKCCLGGGLLHSALSLALVCPVPCSGHRCAESLSWYCSGGLEWAWHMVLRRLETPRVRSITLCGWEDLENWDEPFFCFQDSPVSNRWSQNTRFRFTYEVSKQVFLKHLSCADVLGMDQWKKEKKIPTFVELTFHREKDSEK